jgi:hypothetical protein
MSGTGVALASRRNLASRSSAASAWPASRLTWVPRRGWGHRLADTCKPGGGRTPSGTPVRACAWPPLADSSRSWTTCRRVVAPSERASCKWDGFAAGPSRSRGNGTTFCSTACCSRTSPPEAEKRSSAAAASKCRTPAIPTRSEIIISRGSVAVVPAPSVGLAAGSNTPLIEVRMNIGHVERASRPSSVPRARFDPVFVR